MRAHASLGLTKTKIIATLGPATATREALNELFDTGVDVCRLNFSHGDEAGRTALLRLIRELGEQRGEPIAVIGDLCGPKIRLGPFPDGGLELNVGQTVRFERGNSPCNAERLTTTYPRFVDEVELGQRIYIDDGLVRLLVTERTASALVCICTTGGRVSSGKGINLPDTQLSVPALTDKDRADLEWAIRNELDYVALSFVRTPEDLYELKRLIDRSGSYLRVIVKIEKTEALEHLDELIANADAVLVARGDLGVETDIWRVPLIQKDIVRRCQQAAVPVIVATQMLQSMVESPMPTRAEVSDVANAVFDQADAVMLSAETAVGRYPSQAVYIMNRVAAVTGEYLMHHPPAQARPTPGDVTRPTSAVAHAAVQAALDLKARAVAVWTATGTTVRMVAGHRLPMPVVGLTYHERVYRQMNLLFGVIPMRVEPLDNPQAMAEILDTRLLERRLALPGDVVVVVTSRQPHTPGATDTVLVHRVREPGAG